MSAFLTKDNLMAICTKLYDGKSADVEVITQWVAMTPDMNVKQLALSVMQDVAKDPQMSVLTLVQKNNAVVQIIENFMRSSMPVAEADDGIPEGLKAQKEAAMDEKDIQAKMQRLSDQDVRIALPAATVQSMPDKERVEEEYISLDGGDRDVAVQPLRFAFGTEIEPIRTVSEVKVWSVILPLTPKHASSMCQRVNVTHVWLWVDEISGSFSKNKEDVARRALCKLLIKGCHEPALGRGHMVLEPAMEEVRTFEPPLASLSSFTISLRRPDGALIESTRDDYNMVKVYQTSDAAANWIFEMDRLWEDDAFTKGDILRVVGASTGFRDLDEFLNRKEGHVVITQGYPVGSAFKTIVVRKPGAINQDTGEYEADVDLHEQLANAGNAIDAKVVNMSMQVSVSVSCKCNTTARHFDPSVHTSP